MCKQMAFTFQWTRTGQLGTTNTPYNWLQSFPSPPHHPDNSHPSPRPLLFFSPNVLVSPRTPAPARHKHAIVVFLTLQPHTAHVTKLTHSTHTNVPKRRRHTHRYTHKQQSSVTKFLVPRGRSHHSLLLHSVHSGNGTSVFFFSFILASRTHMHDRAVSSFCVCEI